MTQKPLSAARVLKPVLLITATLAVVYRILSFGKPHRVCLAMSQNFERPLSSAAYCTQRSIDDFRNSVSHVCTIVNYIKVSCMNTEGATSTAPSRRKMSSFTFEKSEVPGSGSTTKYTARDETGSSVPYLQGMQLLAAESEDGAVFRSQLIKVNSAKTREVNE